MNNKFTIFVNICSLSFVILLTFFLVKAQFSTSNFMVNAKFVSSEVESHSTKEYFLKKKALPHSSTITLSAIGDVLIHGLVYKSARVNANHYDFNPIFAGIKPYLYDSDIAFANQESMIGGKSLGLSTYPRFNSPEEVGLALKNIGIDIVSMANNHTMDVGEQGIKNAINLYNDLGILYIGSALSKEDIQKPKIISKKNITTAFLAYTYGTNGIPVPNEKPFLVNTIDEAQMVQDIHRAKNKADVTVVSLHMGTEYQRKPNQDQKNLVKKLANAGADIILGHHPHVLQPVEWIENDDGSQSFVIYSLGNFLSAQKKKYRNIGAILQLEINKKFMAGKSKISIKNPSCILTYVYRDHERKYKITTLSDASHAMLTNTPSVIEMKQHMKQWVPSLQVQ